MNKSAILVVEDEAIIAKDLQYRLEGMGYSVPSTAATGKDAIEKAGELKPDLILMDIMLLGDMDGIEAANEIRLHYDIPVIYLTSYSDEELLERARLTEPFGYMIKPVGDRELYSNIKMTLSKHYMDRQLKESEKTIRKNNEKISLLLNSTAEAIYGLDIDGNCTFCNPSCLHLLGYDSESDLLGKRMHELIHHTRIDLTHYPVEECRIHAVLKDGRQIHVDNEILWRADGSSFYAEYRCHPMYSDGRIIGVVVTFLDISRRKEGENFIKNILESVGEGFIVIGRDYKIMSANRAFCEYVKRPLEDIIGKHCYEVSHYRKTRCYETGEDCPVKHTFATGEPLSVVHTHYDKDGKPYYTEVKSYAMKDETGQCSSVIETINDISEKRKLESQLYHAQKMEAVGLLAGGVAHDFNNILTAITGYGNLVRMKIKKDDPLLHSMNQILSSVERGANLTRSLLAFSRKQAINPRPVNFNTIVENIYKLLKRLIGEDIELKQRLTSEDVTVMADIGQIEQILMNLATNARDAMHKGGCLTLETEVTELDDQYIKNRGFGTPGKYVLISFTDTGVGMDEDTKDKIFEPFFTTKEVGKGTGLGLAMIYGIVKQHRGYINVYSEPGLGTTFKLYFPLIRSVIKEHRKAETVTSYGGTETILLAEDDNDARNLTATVLSEFGYKVIEAKDGQEVIDKFIEHSEAVQLLILDVIMPHKNGREAYDEIIKLSNDMKVIFISGYTADIINRQGLLKENIDFVSKPYTPQEILNKIREVLDK